MSKEKELLKEILANTRAIMDHLKINASKAAGSEKSPKLAKRAQSKKAPAKKSK